MVSTEQPAPDAVIRSLTLGRRLGSAMLVGGAQTEDIEDEVASAMDALGLHHTEVVVSFATISLSYSGGHGPGPVTLVHLVRDRTGEFAIQAEVAALIHRLRTGDLDLDGAEAELDRIEQGRPTYHRAVTYLTPAISAAAATVIFGGSPSDVGATLLIVLAVQPLISLLERTSMVPFFRLAFAVLLTTFAVVAVGSFTDVLDESLVLTGALLRFLPGGSLVAGARDLIDGSVISGTARLAEALLLAAAVAGGATVGLSVGSALGVTLALASAGSVGWPIAVAMAAAAVATVAYAMRIGVPGFALLGVGVAAAVGWLTFIAAERLGPIGGTFAAAAVVGVVGRLFAHRARAPASLWVVPAILPLLPGLAIVNALLAETDAQKVAGLTGAVIIAFALGTGVALGDLAVEAATNLRHRVVEPAVGVAHQGIDVMVDRAHERIIEPMSDVIGGHLPWSRHDVVAPDPNAEPSDRPSG